ncbi:MAG: DEAD/DEAH box helicase [Planctomycetes bacterium]|nr:DEAD/DEAH box helicase [Planctomycetota bacterium]
MAAHSEPLDGEPAEGELDAGEQDAGEQDAGEPATGEAASAAADPFADVPPLLRAALQRRGFPGLTEVQAAVLHADDGVRDLRIRSQTGSGKTVALGLALAARVAGGAGQRPGPTTLVIAPTRELAAQVKEELSWLFADVPGVQCAVVTGGTNIARERMQLSRRPAVVVGTPGRLLDHLSNQALDLSAVRQLVLDEADQMLDLGFKDELDAILAALPAERRTHLVSATFPDAVRELADRFQNKPLSVNGTVGRAHADIEHVALKVASRERYGALVNLLLLAGDQRTLVFVRTREDTQALADELAGDGFLALPIHGDLAQAQRTRTLNAFRRGAIHTLIATDVAARGLDIADVTLVVHFDPPIDGETYVHRSGRTGRAGQKGTSCMLVQKPRANFVRRIYHTAGVAARWEGPPGAAEVRAAQRQRAAEKAQGQLDVATTPELRAAALRLLAGREPEAVVAALLAAAAAGVCDPFEVKMERTAVPFAMAMPSAPAAPEAKDAAAKALVAKAVVTPSAVSPASAAPVAPVRTAAPSPTIPRGDRYEVERRAERSAPVSPAFSPASDAAEVPQETHRVAPAMPAPGEAPARPAAPLPLARRGRPLALPRWQQPADTAPTSHAATSGTGEAPFRRVERSDRRERPDRPGRPERFEARDRDDRRPARPDRRDAADGVRFQINWGARDGADPRRILAHVCRRGDIDGKMVGAIDVHAGKTTFTVAVAVAAEFERRARRPDRRDPGLMISRERPGSR